MWPLQVGQGKSREGFPDKTKYDKATVTGCMVFRSFNSV